MADKIWHITGHVIGRRSKQGIAGLRVEAWDKDLTFNDLVGSAVTDEQDACGMEVAECWGIATRSIESLLGPISDD